MRTSHLINLLPTERVHVLATVYRIRLVTVSLGLVAVLSLMYAGLLLPTHLFLKQQITERSGQIARIDALQAGTSAENIPARTAALIETTTYLTRLATLPTGTTAMRSLLAVPHSHIRITGMTYSAPQNGNARVTITGIADSREALRTYVTALSAVPQVTQADLPVSVYAQESDISFTITLTGSFTP